MYRVIDYASRNRSLVKIVFVPFTQKRLKRASEKNSRRKFGMEGFPASLKWAMEKRGENQLALSAKVGVSQP